MFYDYVFGLLYDIILFLFFVLSCRNRAPYDNPWFLLIVQIREL